MQHYATIEFTDGETKGEALVVVRGTSELIGLMVSLRDDGDTQVFLPREAAERLVETLHKALDMR